MEFTKRQAAVLFLDRDRFDFYSDGIGNVISFPFADNVLGSLEVLNSVELDNQIKAFVEQNGIGPCAITIILSANVAFEKDLGNIPPQQQQEAIQKFIDNVPFDNVESKQISFPEGTRIIAVNKGLTEALTGAFEKMGSAVIAILPYEALAQDFGNLTSLDEQNAASINKKVDSYKNYAFAIDTKILHPTSTLAEQHEEEERKKKTTNRPRLFAMLGAFGILVVILVVLLLRGGL